MKVIHRGYDKTHITTCKHCNSDLEYTERDVFCVKEEKRGGIRKTISNIFRPDEEYINIYIQNYRCIRCPVCGNVIKWIDFSNGLPKVETIRWEKIF